MVLKEYMYLPIWGEVQRLQELHRERNQSWTSAFHSCNKSRAWLDVMGELAINVMGERAHQAWPSAWEQSGHCQDEAGRSASRAGGGALSGPRGELGLVPDADPVGQHRTAPLPRRGLCGQHGHRHGWALGGTAARPQGCLATA